LYEKHNRLLLSAYSFSGVRGSAESKLLERDIIQERTKAEMLGYMPIEQNPAVIMS